MEVTNLDTIVNYPRLILNKIASSEILRELITNKKKATIEDLEDTDGNYKYMFDYDYVDDTTSEEKLYICLDVLPSNVENSHIMEMTIAINVICHKDYMQLDNKIFKGIKGNRRDNVIRYIDKILNGSNHFGIGRLELANVVPITVSKRYTGRALAYYVYDFNHKGEING